MTAYRAVPMHRGYGALFWRFSARTAKGVEMSQQGSLELLNDPVEKDRAKHVPKAVCPPAGSKMSTRLQTR